MAVSDFTGLGDCIRLYTRSGAGFSSSGDGTDITGWTDDSASSINATNESNAPTHDDTPPASALGPAAEYADESDNGFDFGLDLSGDTTWSFGCTVYASTLTSFRNLFSSGGGAAEGSLYTNGGTLTYQEASTESTGSSLSTGTLYTVAFYANATRYRVIVRNSAGSVVIDHTFSITPADQPSIFKVHTYGGSGAGWAGHGWAYVVYSADKIADDATLHAALLEEALGVTGNDGTIAESGLLGTDAATGNFTRSGTVAESGLLGTDAMVGDVPNIGTIAESGLLGVDAMVSTFTLLGSLAESGLLGTDAMSGTVAGDISGTLAESGLLGTDGAEGAPTLDDDFAGSGDLIGWYQYQPSALPAVSRASGRYLAELDDNTGDVTLWFNGNTGRGDFRFIAPGTSFIVHNIGIGQDAANTQTPASGAGSATIFCGIHFNEDLDNPTDFSAHVVVGHRTGTLRTIETKVTTTDTSVVADEGFNAIGTTDTRVDLLFVLDGSGNLSAWWRAANSTDPWNAISWPGATPVFASGCHAGIITYASGSTGVPFVGTADGISEISSVDGTIAESGLLGTDSMVSTLTLAAAIAESGLLGTDAMIGDVPNLGTLAETGLLGTDSMGGDVVGPNEGAIAESGLLGVDALTGDATGVVDGTLGESGLLGQDAVTGALVRLASLSESGLLGTDAMVGSIPSAIDGTLAESGLLGSDAVVGSPNIPRAASVTVRVGTVLTSTAKVSSG